MATIHKLTKDGSTIFPATITDAIVHPNTGKTLTSMIKDYNVSELFPSEGIDGGNRYNLALAIQVLGSHLTAAEKTGGIKITFISSASPYPEEEYFLQKNTWSTTLSDWGQRFEVGDVVANPSGSWSPSTAEEYIDQQTAILNTNITAETTARQVVDSNLQTQINSEVSNRNQIDNTQNAKIGALEDAYRGLTESDVIVGPRPSSGQQANVIYREPDQGHTPPQFYCDYMWYNNAWVLMAQYDNGIDNNPTPGSNNLVKSSGIYNNIGAFDVSVYNGGTIYQSLSAALNAVPQTMRSGGMSIKYIQEYPAKYTVVKTTGITTQPTGTALSTDPNIISGTYTADQLSNFASLPSTLNSSLTYYLETSGTYTTWVITYVQTSDNKYVQYRLMHTLDNASTAAADFANTDNWQGVDDEPTADSENLIKSGSVFELARTIDGRAVNAKNLVPLALASKIYINAQGNYAYGNLPNRGVAFYKIKKGYTYNITIPRLSASGTSTKVYAIMYTNVYVEGEQSAATGAGGLVLTDYVGADSRIDAEITNNTDYDYLAVAYDINQGVPTVVASVAATNNCVLNNLAQLREETNDIKDAVMDTQETVEYSLSDLTENTYYRSENYSIGDVYNSGTSSGTGNKSIKVAITRGDVITVMSSVNNSDKLRPYILTDSNDKIVRFGSVGEIMTEPVTFTAEDNGYLYITSKKAGAVYTFELSIVKTTKGVVSKVEELETEFDSLEGDISIIKGNVLTENPLEIVKETSGMTPILHKIGVIGASFTNGYHNTTSGSLPEEYAREFSWPQRLAKLCGITALHFGHAGWNCKKWLNSSFYTQVADTENKCTAYVISFASNDIYEEDNPDRDYQLGTIADVHVGNESQNSPSYYGYLSKIIARLYEVQPKAYIFLQTYPYNYGRTESLGYSQAMRDIVVAYRNENYRIYLIDYSTYGMTIAEAQNKNMFRGSHYVASGYQYMAYELCTYIDWIIRNNMNEFKDAAFVGTDAEYVES